MAIQVIFEPISDMSLRGNYSIDIRNQSFNNKYNVLNDYTPPRQPPEFIWEGFHSPRVFFSINKVGVRSSCTKNIGSVRRNTIKNSFCINYNETEDNSTEFQQKKEMTIRDYEALANITGEQALLDIMLKLKNQLIQIRNVDDNPIEITHSVRMQRNTSITFITVNKTKDFNTTQYNKNPKSKRKVTIWRKSTTLLKSMDISNKKSLLHHHLTWSICSASLYHTISNE
ncbi:hypothetical protein H8356DRAFT_1426688 [Neocallimastix lanati (nom. inval.)]|nr:hypothetical protein H8356DRAFT_1426688 [Neocallimastix sp. JGI-2020a]